MKQNVRRTQLRRVAAIALLALALTPVPRVVAQAAPDLPPVRLDPGEVLVLPNQSVVANLRDQPFVADDRGDVGGARRVILLGSNWRVEPANGATCRPIPVYVQQECFLPADSWVEVFAD